MLLAYGVRYQSRRLNLTMGRSQGGAWSLANFLPDEALIGWSAHLSIYIKRHDAICVWM